MALSGVITAQLIAHGTPWPVALILGVGSGCVIGFLNGLLISVTKLPPFIITLGTMAILRGATYGLRSGIIGAGFIGEVHARAVRQAGGILSVVADSSPESHGHVAARMGASWATTSPEELIASDDVDVVHICTPNHTHARLARAVIAAGKHVVCEKPLATTVEDAAALVELAAAAGVVCAVPFAYRYYPTVREARARLAAGGLGQVHLIHGSYLQDWLATARDHNWRLDPALGGASRAFADIGVHWCDLVEFTTGHRFTALAARQKTAIPERLIDGRAEPVTTEDAATLVFENRPRRYR